MNNVPMLFGESRLRGKMLADEISVQNRDRASACFQKLGHQNIRDRRLVNWTTWNETKRRKPGMLEVATEPTF